MRILTGIVLYNPEINRLLQNVSTIINQTDCLLLVNNGSSNINDISRLMPLNCIIINNDHNLGVATALNQIIQYALDNDFDWALTLDQDSVSPYNLISVYKECLIGKNEVGLICCKIHDRNANMQRDKMLLQEDGYIDTCITSASMVRVKAWQEVGGFDDSMFIDSVDFDFCINLRQHGWKIFKTYKTSLLHEVGHSKVIKIFGKEYLSLNHAAFRYYYIARNNIYLGRKYGQLLKKIRVIVRTIWTIIKYEDNKLNKLINISKGIIAGATCPINYYIKRTKNEQSQNFNNHACL